METESERRMLGLVSQPSVNQGLSSRVSSAPASRPSARVMFYRKVLLSVPYLSCMDSIVPICGPWSISFPPFSLARPLLTFSLP